MSRRNTLHKDFVEKKGAYDFSDARKQQQQQQDKKAKNAQDAPQTNNTVIKTEERSVFYSVHFKYVRFQDDLPEKEIERMLVWYMEVVAVQMEDIVPKYCQHILLDGVNFHKYVHI